MLTFWNKGFKNIYSLFFLWFNPSANICWGPFLDQRGPEYVQLVITAYILMQTPVYPIWFLIYREIVSLLIILDILHEF